MFSANVYQQRREALKKLVAGGTIFLAGNEQSSMSFKDNWYPFRQDSSFLYFTGIDLPSLALVINVDEDTETLFGDDLSVDDIIWHGPQPTLAETASKAGIDNVHPLQQLQPVLRAAQSKKQTIHYLPPYRSEHTELLTGCLGLPAAGIQHGASVPLIKAIVALRSIKSAEEVAEIKKAVNTTAEMQLFAMNSARPGMTEATLAGPLQGLSIGAGGNLSFPTILTTRGEVLHNHYSTSVLTPGSLVLLDCGAETDMHYAGDLTRTFPVNTTFTQMQKDVYNIVYSAQQAAVNALQPGALFKDIHLLACEKLTAGLQDLGLMKGDLKESVAAGAHTLFFQCGLGHMMGLDVHDMESLGEQYVGYNEEVKKSKEFGLKSLRLGKALQAGFVITVEPGLYFIPELMDIWKAGNRHTDFINYDQLDAFRKFGGIRIEDDFLITDTGSELLSTSLPRTVDKIEAVRAGGL